MGGNCPLCDVCVSDAYRGVSDCYASGTHLVRIWYASDTSASIEFGRIKYGTHGTHGTHGTWYAWYAWYPWYLVPMVRMVLLVLVWYAFVPIIQICVTFLTIISITDLI